MLFANGAPVAVEFDDSGAVPEMLPVGIADGCVVSVPLAESTGDTDADEIGAVPVGPAVGRVALVALPNGAPVSEDNGAEGAVPLKLPVGSIEVEAEFEHPGPRQPVPVVCPMSLPLKVVTNDVDTSRTEQFGQSSQFTVVPSSALTT